MYLAKPFFLQTAISISGSIEIVFGRLVASIKCWSDLQLLSAGSGTGVIFEFIKSILKSLVILAMWWFSAVRFIHESHLLLL